MEMQLVEIILVFLILLYRADARVFAEGAICYLCQRWDGIECNSPIC